MSITLNIEGFKELERQLAELKTGTATGVARRAMKKALAPVAEAANAFWPGADEPFKVSSRVSRRHAQRRTGRNVLDMYVGAQGGPDGAPEAHLVEWGTGPRYHKKGKYVGAVAPNAILQPAWDSHQDAVLAELSRILGEEIQKTFARLGKS